VAILVVQAKPPRRFRVVSGRTALFVALLSLAAGVIAGGYRFLTSATTSSDEVVAGAAESYPPQTVTYVAKGHFYLVHFDGDQFVALFERSPWLQAVHGTAPTECRIRWYLRGEPDWQYSPNHPGTDDRDPIGNGFFRETCSGWVFDAHGERLFGGSAPLDRFHLYGTDGNVVVDTSTMDRSWWLHSPSY
jgi:hypothetical protein